MSSPSVKNNQNQDLSSSIGILFDFNGVIVDDEIFHEMAFAKVISAYGVTLTPDVYKRHCLGKTDIDGLASLQAAFPGPLSLQQPSSLVLGKQEEYKRLVSTHDVLYPGVLGVISAFTGLTRLGIVTSSTRTEVEMVLDEAHIAERFQVVISVDDVVRGKPDPEGYLKGIAALGLPSTRIVAVEDSRSGVAAAKAAGLKCVAVLHSTTANDVSQADRVISNIVDFNLPLVEKLLGEKTSR